MNQSDKEIVESFLKTHSELIEALGNEKKDDLYQDEKTS
jgi:hypothetical protein